MVGSLVLPGIDPCTKDRIRESLRSYATMIRLQILECWSTIIRISKYNRHLVIVSSRFILPTTTLCTYPEYPLVYAAQLQRIPLTKTVAFLPLRYLWSNILRVITLVEKQKCLYRSSFKSSDMPLRIKMHLMDTFSCGEMEACLGRCGHD